MIRMLTLALLLAAHAAADGPLDAARAEPNLEKRSEKALQAAQKTLDTLRRTGDLSDRAGVQAALTGIRDGVELCVDSLEESGKNPRRSPKYFKRAEISLRKLNRQLEDLRVALSADDRAPVAALLAYTVRVQEDLLLGIFTKKK
ncbi:MAG: hypothetical protein IT164_18320 [Bryobacterales bacterium]|nr:hypothetical protein [Bryobacterales bacterium]